MAKSITVEPDAMSSAVEKILEEYFDGIYSGAEKAVAETAAETVLDLENRSPKDSGKYASSWQVTQTVRSKRNNEVVINNKRYMLTHLLEHGHIKVVHGTVLGFTAARPHIAFAEKMAIKKLDNRIKEAAKG